MLEWFLVACFGLCLGSFMAVVCVRIPNNQSIWLPRSHCPMCQKTLHIQHLIPVVSFIFLKGRCAFCQQRISWLYISLELAVLVVVLALYERWGLIADTVYLSIVFACLICASVIDLKYQAVSSRLLFVTLILTYMYLYHTQFHFMTALLDSFALAGMVSLLAIFLNSFSGRKSLGEGDIVVVAIASAILGSQHAFIALFIASAMALLGMVAGDKKRVAFIPYLSIATFMVLFWVS